MRIALIVLDTAGTAHGLRFAGKSLAAVHLDIALAAGCTRIVCVGKHLDKATLELQHRAERAGAGFVLRPTVQALLGSVSAGDELLVFAGTVLPDRRAVLDATAAPAVLTFPSDPAVSQGFERIDAVSAWAGVLLTRADVLERLCDLPPDVDPASAILRAALQSGTPRRLLADNLLANREWLASPSQADLDELAHGAARRAAGFSRFTAPGTAVAERLAARFWHDSGGGQRRNLFPSGALMAGAGAMASAALDMPEIAFALLALMAVLSAMGSVYGRIESEVLAEPQPVRLDAFARAAFDPLLVACLALAAPEDESWLRLYLPAVMVLALHLATRHGRKDLAAPFADRVALAALAVPAAWLGLTQGLVAVVTLAALVVLSLSLPRDDS